MTSASATAGHPSPGLVTAMLMVFAGVFLADFVERPPDLFLLPLGAFVFGAVDLLARSRGEGSGRGLSTTIGASALLFAMGLVYGAGGFWWDYAVVDVLYVGGVMVVAAVYLVSSLVCLRAGRRARR